MHFAQEETKKMEFKFKLSVLIMSLSLTACGGSSGNSSNNITTDTSGGSDDSAENADNSSDDANTSIGDVTTTTGNCVTIARPQVGRIEVTFSKGYDDFTPDSYWETKIIAFSDTFSSIESTSRSGSATGKIINQNISTSTHTIANNFIKTTQGKVTGSSITTDETGKESTEKFNNVTVYSPFTRNAIDRVCEGQTWTNDYDATTTSNVENSAPFTSTFHTSQIYTIEAINVKKTVPAGTFNTVQQTLVDGTTIIRMWGDIATGMNIASEYKNNEGEVITYSELISFTP